MRDSDGDGYGDASTSGNDDAGTDCNDRSAADNNDDEDGDSFTTCGGDCDDGRSSVNPSEEEVCDNGLDDNCDDRTDEYCAFEEASGSIRFYRYWDTSSPLCVYSITEASWSSEGYCEDCQFHFREYDTRLTSGSSTTCRSGFSTWFSVDPATDVVFLRTNLANVRYDVYGEITYWQENSTHVDVSWEAYVYDDWGYTSIVEGYFWMYGDW